MAGCAWHPRATAARVVTDQATRTTNIVLLDADDTCPNDWTVRAKYPIGDGFTMVCDECRPLMSRVVAAVSILSDADYQAAGQRERVADRNKLHAAILDYWKANPEDANGNAGIELAALVSHLGAKRNDVTAALLALGFAVRQVGTDKVRRWLRPAYLSESEAD